MEKKTPNEDGMDAKEYGLEQSTNEKEYIYFAKANGALGYVQATLKANKGLYNDFGKYKYRSCETILESVKPILASIQAIVLLTDELVMIGERYYIKATATFTLCQNGESISTTAYAREEECKKGMDGSQITGASSSYARKYALNGLFAIDDSVDSDGTNDGEPEMITAEQIKEFEKLGVKLDNVFKRYKIKSVNELTKEQAIFIIDTKRKSLTGE